MSVSTTYEDKLEELKEKVNECLILANELCTEDMWGKEDYPKGHARKYRNALEDLVDLF